ncbi:PREDICTED: BAG family molecular chaperone regulator 6 [Lupinus angustifolius]|uniref:BAG family molecular chaperone regulator 6 n=1 Tax=Lupinus angustifolius TaxID=3871 RepID=UPI00092F8D10|nr:PREDICTED: BAG family molecular chaperone regulator 6 [Lupinus angustifolius]
MMPAYRNMDSYPYQRNQMPFPDCYHMKVDPSKSPFPYEQSWPYAATYGQSIPMHSCCSHNNFPGYYSYRPYPPHAPAPSPSPIYHSGCYPVYGEPFFVPYSLEPHYAMEMPRYEYDKYMPRGHHCCGCPNHLCHRRGDQSVRIEEQEPEAGKKVNDALVPTQLKNYPYPFVVMPPEYANSRELKSPHVRPELGEQDMISSDRKPPGNGCFRADAQEPKVWNGLLPFGMYGVPDLVHEGGGKRNLDFEMESNRSETENGRISQKQESEHKRPEFPFPIFWMPNYKKQEEEGSMTNNQKSASAPTSIEVVPSTLKSDQANSHADEVVTKATESHQDKSTNASGLDVTEKVNNEIIIPVEQMELRQGKVDTEGSGKKVKNIPVIQREDILKNEYHSSGERQSRSPRKTSKLPPVCLRVDPLPKKKNGNGNGSSRSPSPPASKGHSPSAAGETSNTPSGGMNDKARPNSNFQNAPNIGDNVKPKEKTIQVSENKTNASSQSPSFPASNEHSQAAASETSKTFSGMNDKAQPNLQNALSISEKDKPQEKTIQVAENRTSEYRGAEICAESDKQEIKAEKGAGNKMEEATELNSVRDSSNPTGEGRKRVKALTNVDAAVLIQAAYRGYQVRKWEPLKKLKQLADVRTEVTDVKARVEAFEDSSNVQSDDKQRIAIGETIMRLLLKCDTVQGLHSSLREVRKSLARELISLQERLDSMKATKPHQQMQELIDSKPVEKTSMDEQNEEYVQDQQQEEVAVPRGYSSEDISLEECQDHQSCMKDCINSFAAHDVGSESHSPMDLTSDEGTEPILLQNEDDSQVVIVDACNLASDISEADKMVVEHEAKSNASGISIDEVHKSDKTSWKELHMRVVDEDTTEKEKVENMEGSLPAMVYDEMIALPVGLPDGDTAAPEFEKHNETQVSTGEFGTEDEKCIMELPGGLLDEDTTTPDLHKDDSATISKEEPRAEDRECIMELPVGLLDEDTKTPDLQKDDSATISKDDGIAKFESEKHDETKISEEVLPDEGNADNSSTDDTAKEIQVEQEEVQPYGESDSRVMVEFQKEGEMRRNATLDLEVETQPGKEITIDIKVPLLITQHNCHEQDNGNEYLEVNDAKNIQPEDMLIECAENVAQKETQIEGHDLVAKCTETLARDGAGLSGECDGGSDGDRRVLEENEKLRKMMQKLVDAGNEQLNVISKLSGRVKELEKKLARSKKRVRTKRCRPATSKTGSNNAVLSHS